MKILIDTNVLLDVLTQRQPFYNDSAIIWSLTEECKVDGFVSAISVNNIHYITRRLTDADTAGIFVDKVLKDFKVLPLTFDILKLARTKKGDYEDLIQYFSALHVGCDYIITRDPKGFPKQNINIASPAAFIRTLSRKK